MKKVAVFRCDASLSIGSGHIVRCLTLAKRFSQSGIKSVFVCRQQNGNLIHYLQQAFPVCVLPYQDLRPTVNEINEPLVGQDLYNTWLGVPQSVDAEQTFNALVENKILDFSWLVVDHYGLDYIWQTEILSYLQTYCSSLPKLLVIDDLANRRHIADYLLDQNYHGLETEFRYESLLPKTCKQLLGPHYALLSPEYSTLHPIISRDRLIRRVLVYFGGTDNDNATGLTLEALLALEFSEIAVDVVVSTNYRFRDHIEALVSQRPLTFLHHSLASLAGLIARADLAIGAGGCTTWERLCLGLPSIVISTAQNQSNISLFLSDLAVIIYLGHVDEVTVTHIRTTIHSYISGQISCSPSNIYVDGFGASRVVTSLSGLHGKLLFRPARPADEQLLLAWRNDRTVRNVSLSQDVIGSEDHHIWFSNGLENMNRLHWIATDTSSFPVGQVRFDRSHCSSQARISFSLDPSARGHKLSFTLISTAIDLMRELWGMNIDIMAEVLSDNIASQITLRKAGFFEEGHDTDCNNITYWRLPSN